MGGYGAVAATILGVEAVGKANAIQGQAEYQKTMSDINSRNLELQSKRATELGDLKAKKYQEQINDFIGKQKNAYASSGIDISFGSASQVIKQSRELGFQDVQNIRTNAFLDAMGYKAQATEATLMGEMQLASAKSEYAQTLLGGALRGYSAYGAYKNK